MKKSLYVTLMAPLFFALNALAQTPPPIAEPHRWLYEILFSENDRLAKPAESFKSFYVHLEDSYKVFPHPDDIRAQNLRLIERIEGTIVYVKVVQKKYVYDVLKAADGTLVLNVRVHLKDPVGADMAHFREKIAEAQEIWNQARVPVDFSYAFKFDLVENERDSHFSVNVFDQTRGPYDRNWGRNWSSTTVAHELGHMLGLGDEYQTLSSKIDCLPSSLMCVSSSGKLQPHHFYFVLRRLTNAVIL